MITVIDKAGILDSTQRHDLETTNASSHVVVNLVSVGSPTELDNLTQSCVTTPNTLCVGRDNSHKWTSVHPGIDLGIKGDAAVEVRKAGNAEFRQGDLVGGLKAIVSRSEAVRMKQNQTAVIIDHQVVKHETTYWTLFVIGGGLIAVVVFFVIKARRSAKKAEDAMRVAQGEAADAVSRNIEADREEETNRKIRHLERPAGADNMALGGVPTLYTLDHSRPMPGIDEVPASGPYRPSGPAPAPIMASAPTPSVVHHYHHRTPAPLIVNSGPDFVDGLLIGEALSRRNERYAPVYEPPRRREPTPEPVRTSEPSFGWGGGPTRDADSDSASSSVSVTSDDDNSSSSDTPNVGSDDD